MHSLLSKLIKEKWLQFLLEWCPQSPYQYAIFYSTASFVEAVCA
jgi:hypothetical protein